MRIILEDITGKRRGPFETGDYEPMAYVTYRGKTFARRWTSGIAPDPVDFVQAAFFEIDDDMLVSAPEAGPAGEAAPAVSEEQASFL